MSKGSVDFAMKELAKELGIRLDCKGRLHCTLRNPFGTQEVIFEGDQLMYVLICKKYLKYWKDAYPRWIPCTERMPEPHTAVLVWNGKDVGIGWNNPDVPESDCTHWMPLPEGPE